MRIFGFSIPLIIMLLAVYVIGSKWPNKIPVLNKI